MSDRVEAVFQPNLYVCNGNPNGVLAGNAAYTAWADAPPDLAWDGGNFWVCTTSGSASGAVWSMLTTTNLKTVVNALGTVSSGTVAINRANGPVQKLTVGGALTVTLAGWLAGGYSTLRLELVNGGSAAVTWPTGINWITPVTGVVVSTFAGTDVTLQTAGTDWVDFWSPDGTTIFAKVLR